MVVDRPMPGRPLMFAVDHELKPVAEAMDEFRRRMQGKKVLYIELGPLEISNVAEDFAFRAGHPFMGGGDARTASYQKLVAEALRAGLEVKPLDTQATRMEIVTFRAFKARRPNMAYRVIHLRERRWVGILKNVGGDAIVVMHPGHAEEVARQLELPKANFVRAGELSEARRENVRRLRARADEQRAAIEAKRLKRAGERRQRRTKLR